MFKAKSSDVQGGEHHEDDPGVCEQALGGPRRSQSYQGHSWKSNQDY